MSAARQRYDQMCRGERLAAAADRTRYAARLVHAEQLSRQRHEQTGCHGGAGQAFEQREPVPKPS